MSIGQIVSYVFRDMMTLRVAGAILAGTATLAFATMVTALSASFSMSVNVLLESTVQPNASVAGILRVVSRTLEGRFSKEDFDTLMARVKELEEEPEDRGASTTENIFDTLVNRLRDVVRGESESSTSQPRITAVSPVVTKFSSDVFRFLDHAGADLSIPGGVSLWSTPMNSPFLARSKEMEYASGGSFEEAARRFRVNGESQAKHQEDYRPRLGVIVNEEFYRHYLNRTLKEWEHRFEDEEFRYPEAIKIGLRRSSVDSEGRPPHVVLAVTGVVSLNRGFYPHLFFTEDLAKAYFLDSVLEDLSGKKIVTGRFPGEFAHRFVQLENGKPLEPPPGLEPEGFFPTEKSQLDYVELGDAGDSPYDLLILGISNWQTEGSLREIREALNRMVPRVELGHEEAKRVGRFASRAASREVRADGRQPTKVHDLTNARVDLRHAILGAMSEVVPDFELSMRFDVLESDREGIFDIVDGETGSHVRIVLGSGGRPSRLLTAPPWEAGEAMDLSLRRTLLRLGAIIDTYDNVLFFVVFVLSVSASLLMAFNHVFNKQHDIGLLLTNGAGPYSVVSIYVGQIMLLATLGAFVGVALSYLAAPLIENEAAETMRNFLMLAELDGTIEIGTLMSPNFAAIGRALLWVVPAAFIGALYPVARSVHIAPQESVAKGS